MVSGLFQTNWESGFGHTPRMPTWPEVTGFDIEKGKLKLVVANSPFLF